LPRLLGFEKQRACPVLCATGTQYYFSTEDCLLDCNRLVDLFDDVDGPRPGTTIQGEAEYEGDGIPCFPVADVNVIGIPSFGDIDVRHDDVIDFAELSLYGFLLCIPDVAVNDLFYSLDHDQDSLVTPMEWSSTGLAISAESQTSSTTTSSQTTTPMPTADGYVQELLAGHLPSFEGLDTNSDEHVEPYEFAGAFMNILIGQHPLMSPLVRAGVYDSLAHGLFQTLDTDGDHYISKEEWDAAESVLRGTSPPAVSELIPQGNPSSSSGPSSPTTSIVPGPPGLPTIEAGDEMGAAVQDNTIGDMDGNDPAVSEPIPQGDPSSSSGPSSPTTTSIEPGPPGLPTIEAGDEMGPAVQDNTLGDMDGNGPSAVG
jgi:hypothetical protein